MSITNPQTEVPMTLADIQRLQRWYRSYVLKNPSVDAHDLVLNAHLDTVRTAIEDRLVVRAQAIRSRSDVQRFQHTGAERRSRVTVPTRPPRITRAVAITH